MESYINFSYVISGIIIFIYTCVIGYVVNFCKFTTDKLDAQREELLSKNKEKVTYIDKEYIPLLYDSAVKNTKDTFDFLKEITLYAFKGLFLINGGGATAIAVYLGSNYGNISIYSKGVSWGLASFCFGVFFVVACMVFSYLAQGYFVSIAYFDQKAMENRLLYTKSNDKAKSDNEAKSNETIGNNFCKAGNSENKYADNFRLWAICCGVLALFFAGLGLLLVTLVLILW